MVKSRYQADGVDPRNCKYSSYMDCIKKSYREHGLRTFSQGLGSTLLRAIPTNAVTFLTVEWVFRLCEGYLVWEDHAVDTCPDPEHHGDHRHYEEENPWLFFPLPEAGATVLDPIVGRYTKVT